MKIAVLQPYFFPYIGYFQLMRAVDAFVFFDDVQYIERGWVNRNLVRLGDTARWLTMPVARAPRDTAIKGRHYLPCGEKPDASMGNLLAACYAKAPHYAETDLLIRELFGFTDRNVSAFNANLLTRIARRLGIACEFTFSSGLVQKPGLKGQDKVIDICRQVGAGHYINPIGGLELYDAAAFRANDVALSFLRTTSEPAELHGGPKHLSIIDWLMHHGEDGCAAHLHEFAIVEPQ